jgi:hypothetical protein
LQGQENDQKPFGKCLSPRWHPALLSRDKFTGKSSFPNPSRVIAHRVALKPLLQIGPATSSLVLKDVGCWSGGGPNMAQTATPITRAVRTVVLTQ